MENEKEMLVNTEVDIEATDLGNIEEDIEGLNYDESEAI